MATLTRDEAERRFELIDVRGYDLTLDLDTGEEVFASTSSIVFGCGMPGASSWLDVSARTVSRVLLNGESLDVATVVDGRLPLPGLRAVNTVLVEATMAYSNDGQGLHRAVDPADGRHYVFGHLFLDAAPRVFGCFDQPDLKAPFTLRVTVPADWIVLGNGAATRTGHRTWELTTTLPLATYFVTVCAGPYVSLRSEHDGIPLGLHARASLGDELERHGEQMFEVTRRCFDYYHELFGIRYPFGEYHQIFVPEFNAGAMENPGCVVFRDPMLFRGAVTRDHLLARSNTIAHEMAHMWFGDLVTMKWWDDLWLNESFAEYMASRALVAATEFSDAWVQTSVVRKAWGYAAERSPSAHPVAGAPAPDAQTALLNFDGISYAKGSAALRQLIAYLGDDAFVAGVRDYLTMLSYGNGTMADFLAALEKSSGRSLGAWADAWLRTTGRDVLRVELEQRGGLVTAARLYRESPAEHPADRPHALDVRAFERGAEVFAADVVVVAGVTALPGLVGHSVPAVIANAGDLTWAALDLGDDVVESVVADLSRMPVETRAMLWTALEDGVARAAVDPRAYLRCFVANWPEETDSSILGRVSLGARDVIIDRFLPAAERPGARVAVDRAAAGLAARADPGSEADVLAARTRAAASADGTLLAQWLAGTGLPAPLSDDSDFRWIVVQSLVRIGHLDTAAIEEVRRGDDTLSGKLAALEARASRPDAGDKAWAWHELTTRHGRSYSELDALARGFWLSDDAVLLEPYVQRYFSDIPAMAGWVGEDALLRVAVRAFPRIAGRDLLELAVAALERTDLTAAVRRAIVDEKATLEQVLASRARFPG